MQLNINKQINVDSISPYWRYVKSNFFFIVIVKEGFYEYLTFTFGPKVCPIDTK